MASLQFRKWSDEYVRKEYETARANLDNAERNHPGRLNPIETVQAVYADKLKRYYPHGIKESLHAYSESGSLGISILLHRATVKELFPIPRKNDLEKFLGMSVEMLTNCLHENLIILLVQLPKQYEKLEYLHPILMQYEPPCYEIRDKIIYQYLSNGHYDEYVEHGLKNRAIAVSMSTLNNIEEYEKYLPTDDKARWDLRYAQRYAALAALSDEQTILEALEVEQYPPNSEDNIRHVHDIFFDLHRKVIHPLTQGLGGLPYNNILFSDKHDLSFANSRIERELFRTLSKPMPDRPSMKQIVAIQETDLPDRFAEIESEIVSKATESVSSVEGIETAIDDVLNELMEQTKRIDKGVKLAEGALCVASVGAGILDC